MYKILIFTVLLGLSYALPQIKKHNDELVKDEAQILKDEEIYRNTHAKYQFATDVQDQINDLSQQRSEVRDGSKVIGMYSYSDGYVRRTIHYEADDKGYRITKQDLMPLDLDGPKVNVNGKASVNTQAHGTKLRYVVQSVTAKDLLPKLADASTFVEIKHPSA